MADMSEEEVKQKILEFLGTIEGKGVEVTVRIAKGVGVDRKTASKALTALESEGKVAVAGATAGVVGYKLAGN